MAHKASHSKFLASPHFLEMPAVSIEILESGIYFFTSKKTSQGIIPDQFGFMPLLVGESPVKALIAIKKRTGVDFVRFSIPEEQTYIFKINLPELKPEEIRDILDFKLEENIPLTSKEAVFDYDIVRQRGHKNSVDVVVSAAPLRVIEELQTLFNSAGLTSTFFSPESNNLARAVVKEGNEQVLVTVNIRETKIILSLVVSGTVYQTSTVNFGSATFTEALAKYYKVPVVEALKLKGDRLYQDHPDNTEMFAQIISTVSTIKDELDKFISYCNEREDISSEVHHVILCGQDALIVGLSKYLSSGLNIPVEIANIWSNNFKLEDCVPEISRSESLNYAVVNGLNLF